MDENAEQFEILFAQNLARGEARVRHKAMRRLRQWFMSRMKFGKGFSRDEFMTIWKGLYCCMWMQDKPLLQEELAKTISELLDCFELCSEDNFLFIGTFFDTLSREWYKIDRWRMDKYLMVRRFEKFRTLMACSHMVRCFLRHYLERLDKASWTPNLVERSLSVLSSTVLSDSSVDVPDGLRFHFAAVYLDELDAASKQISSDVLTQMLQPYVDLLARRISDPFFSSIVTDVFEAVLLQASDRLQSVGSSAEPASVEDETEPQTSALQFDYDRIAHDLLVVGGKQGLHKSRRKVIYELVKKFRMLAAGEDPCVQVISSGSEDELNDEEIERAARRLAKSHQADDRTAFKRKRKRQMSPSIMQAKKRSEPVVTKRKRRRMPK